MSDLEIGFTCISILSYSCALCINPKIKDYMLGCYARIRKDSYFLSVSMPPEITLIHKMSKKLKGDSFFTELEKLSSPEDIPVEVITIPLMITLSVFVVAILLFIFIRQVFHVTLGFLISIYFLNANSINSFY